MQAKVKQFVSESASVAAFATASQLIQDAFDVSTFLRSRECRHVLVSKLFGDPAPNRVDGALPDCDNCAFRADPANIKRERGREISALLRTIQLTGGALKFSDVVNIVRGHKPKNTKRDQVFSVYRQLDTWGSLKGRSGCSAEVCHELLNTVSTATNFLGRPSTRPESLGGVPLTEPGTQWLTDNAFTKSRDSFDGSLKLFDTVWMCSPRARGARKRSKVVVERANLLRAFGWPSVEALHKTHAVPPDMVFADFVWDDLAVKPCSEFKDVSSLGPFPDARGSLFDEHPHEWEAFSSLLLRGLQMNNELLSAAVGGKEKARESDGKREQERKRYEKKAIAEREQENEEEKMARERAVAVADAKEAKQKQHQARAAARDPDHRPPPTRARAGSAVDRLAPAGGPLSRGQRQLRAAAAVGAMAREVADAQGEMIDFALADAKASKRRRL
jgi:hypothetical protein